MELKTFQQAMQQIAEEKGIPAEKVVETLELALAAAYKKDYGKKGQIIRAKFDPKTGHIIFTQIKIAVDESMIKSEEEVKAEEEARQKALEEAVERRMPRRRNDEEAEIASELALRRPDAGLVEEERKVRFNTERHLMIDEAQKIKKDANPGDELEFPLESHADFGRIASQTAKQVIIQRIREAEREATYEEYKNREGEIVSGLIQRIEGKNIFVDLGRGIGVLPPEEQLPREFYRIGDRVKALIVAVEKDMKGSGIFLSRTHPRLLKKLFEIEVPEIGSGAVEIKIVAREPGSRSKIAVSSNEQGVDPVGSLVGQKGVRVSTVINEINGEKIDIIEWSEDPAEFIAHALSPAKVLEVQLGTHGREARVIVPADQLSLAIGRGGQNVRLAAKLTGWKIDVRSRETNEGGSATSEGEFAETAEGRPELMVKQEPESIPESSSGGEAAASPHEEISGTTKDAPKEQTEEKPKKKKTALKHSAK